MRLTIIYERYMYITIHLFAYILVKTQYFMEYLYNTLSFFSFQV